MEKDTPKYWAVRGAGAPTSVRITPYKVSSLEEACIACFGTDSYHMEGKPLTSRIADLRVNRKRLEWLRDPTGWVKGRGLPKRITD